MGRARDSSRPVQIKRQDEPLRAAASMVWDGMRALPYITSHGYLFSFDRSCKKRE